MIANRSKGTKIELLLGKMMWNAGIRYRKNDSSLPGTPDFTIRKARVAIFCDGEFWHGHNWEERKNDIKSNRDFWYAKIERNIERDRRVNEELRNMGWKVFRFWENDIRHEPDVCLRDILDYIHIVDSDRKSPSYTYGSACKKLNLYGPHSYNRDGSIMSVNDQMAVVSHYVHNYGNDSVKAFSNEGYGLIEDIRRDADGCTMVCEEDVRSSLYNETFASHFPPPNNASFTFIDLFAGIGGMRLAMQRLGGRCVFASEWNAEAARVYFNNFGEAPFGDITKEEIKAYIPNKFDILCASLPLQAFALAHRRDLNDKIKGTLFADTAEIIRRREPKAVLLEFQARQLNYAKGAYTNIITDVLNKELGYYVMTPVILNASDFSSAMDKDYMFVVAISDNESAFKFKYPESTDSSLVFKDIMETEPVSANYYLSEKQADRINGKYKVINIESKLKIQPDCVLKDCKTIDILPSTRRLNNINREGLRRITNREYMRLYGLPDSYWLTTDNEVARQLLNAVSMPDIIYEIGKNITESITIKKHTFRYGD